MMFMLTVIVNLDIFFIATSGPNAPAWAKDIGPWTRETWKMDIGFYETDLKGNFYILLILCLGA
jgi:hypothetical protein